MDSIVGGFSDSKNRFEFDLESISAYSDPEVIKGFQFKDTSPDSDISDLPSTSIAPGPVIQCTDMSKRLDRDSVEELDLSDAVLKFINQVLMEDDLEDDDCTTQDSFLHDAEKSFYKILNQKDPSWPNQPLPDLEFPVNGQPGWQFIRGMKKTKKILPSGNGGTCDFDNGLILIPPVENKNVSKVKAKPEKNKGGLMESLPRGRRKSIHREESDSEEEGRSKKHFLTRVESVLHEMFDKVLSLHESEVKRSNGKMTYPGRRVSKREAIDTRSLLIHCMKSVASNDHRSASELLNQIRQRSSPLGDGSQRLAHYFANTLEVRMVGSGGPELKSIAANLSDADALKAYKLYLTAFPFMEASYYFQNQVIMELAESSTSLHIIYFGIRHGLQCSSLIQRLSTRPGGPPKLRITGIDLPQASFRLAAMTKETGCRLATYCERFNVPFEYNSIVQKWETINVEDLGIKKEELVVVLSLYQFMFLLDDTTMKHSPRDAVLNLIRRISPDIFIHGIVNGNYNSPFFVSRFREALFHFSALFDMFEANVPRENQERMVFERDVLGNSFFNVLACEGSERVVRPETYKQWQVRTVRAGFRQLPLNHQMLKEVRAKVKSCYHKDFLVDEAGQWMVIGWKERVLHAFSCWKPA